MGTVSLGWGLETGRQCQLILGQAQQAQFLLMETLLVHQLLHSSASATILLFLLEVGPLFCSGEPCLFNPHTLHVQPMAPYTAELQCLLTEWALTPIKTDPRHGLTGLKSCMGFCQAWIGSQSTLPSFPKENIGLGSAAGHSPQALLGYN